MVNLVIIFVKPIVYKLQTKDKRVTKDKCNTILNLLQNSHYKLFIKYKIILFRKSIWVKLQYLFAEEQKQTKRRISNKFKSHLEPRSIM